MNKVIGCIPAMTGGETDQIWYTRILNGKPLLAYTIEAAAGSQVFSDTFVYSDDESVLSLAQELGAETKRPQKNEPFFSIDDLVTDLIEQQNLSDDNIIIILGPASPLRNATHIVEALQWFSENNCDGLKSVRTLNPKVLLAYVEDQQYLKPLTSERGQYLYQRQLPVVYLDNQAIFIFSVTTFKQYKSLPTQKLVPFVMSKKESICVESEENMRTCSHHLMDLPERRER
jgi:CMP-N-acetylneuraminic acid synthetase